MTGVLDNKFVIDSGKECIKHCPYETIRPKLILTGNAVLKLRYLQEKFTDVEFLVYGNSVKTLDNSYTFVIEDVVVPKQVVGMASVDNIEIEGNFNTVIHKHPGNATGFSHVDDEFVNSNHDFSIVIGNDKKLNSSNGMACIKIDCGRYMKATLDIDVVIPKSKDVDFIKSTENIMIKMDSVHSIISNIKGFIGTNKKQTQNLCGKCKEPLEKTDDNNKWECKKCKIKYVK